MAKLCKHLFAHFCRCPDEVVGIVALVSNRGSVIVVLFDCLGSVEPEDVDFIPDCGSCFSSGREKRERMCFGIWAHSKGPGGVKIQN